MQAAAPGAIQEAAREARSRGDALRCYDLAMRGLGDFPQDHALNYLACLALADLGSIDLAFELYERHDALAQQGDEDWLALRGRLHKELAWRGGRDAREEFQHAAEAYEAAFALTRRSFSGINAASMRLLAGDRDGARELAREVRGLLAAESPADESAAYFQHVTAAEAALVLGDVTAARAALQAADPLRSRDATARSRTLAQLRRVCAANAIDPAILSALRLPGFVCIGGEAGVPGDAATAETGTPVGAVFVVPGECGEIAWAERFAAAGAPLHLVLCDSTEATCERLAARLGRDWAARAARLIAQAQDVSMLSGFVEGEESQALAYARQVALGLARLRARQTGAEWRVLGGEATSAPAFQPTWACALPGHESSPLQRRQAALIFADMTGFSRLSDEELPPFWTRLMVEMSRTLARYAPHVLLQSTWGDALYLVIDAAQPAAAAAVDIVDTVTRVRGELPGALASINLRLSVHYAPVFGGWDPVGLGKLYYGSHVSLAARIEPVTPPGCIYVTEALAAQLTLEGAQGFDLVYAGEVELAKRYGRRRMFHLRAVGSRPAPRVEAPSEQGAVHETVIGCTGSLLLTDPQKDWVRQMLQERVLPELRAQLGLERVRLAMGLAPGADLLFLETAREWAAAQGLPYRMQALLPAPAETLLGDWNERVAQAGLPEAESETRATWARMSRALHECASVVKLWPVDSDAVDLAMRSFRQRQYRRLGAYLVAHCDVLVAIYNRSARGGPGGAAEVVKWWRDPAQIPQALDIAPPPERPRVLAIIDPVRRDVVLEGG